MGALQPLAVVQDYPELQAAFRAYAERINVARSTIDALVGWADGYAGKTLAAAPSRGIGSGVLGDFLKGMGLVLIVAQDVEQFEQIKHRLPARDERQARDGHPGWPEQRRLGVKGRRTPKRKEASCRVETRKREH